MWTDESYRQELVSILQQRKLQPLFQPVLDFNTGYIQGYEALIRGPSDSPLHSPLVLFKVAHQCQLLPELGGHPYRERFAPTIVQPHDFIAGQLSRQTFHRRNDFPDHL